MKEQSLGRGLTLALLALLIFFAVQLGVLYLLSGVVIIYKMATGNAVNLDVEQQLPAYQIWVTLLGTLISILLLWGMKWLYKTQIRFHGLPCKHILALMLILVGMSFGCSALLEFLNIPDFTGDILMDMMQDYWGVLAISIVGPIGEEAIFRGAALQKLMDKGWSPTAAIWISALLFGIAHLNPVQIIYASILGLLLGWVYVRTKSLIPCIGLHIFNNLTSVILSLTAENPYATYAEMFGKTGAILIMVMGLLVSAITFCYMRFRLKEMY